MTEPELTPERLARLQEWFDRAVDQPPEVRAAILAELAATDADLARQLRALLAAHDRTGSVLRSPIRLGPPVPGGGPDPRVGTRVGPYRIERVIGSGGMGSVYEGVRADAQFDHRVAIKFLHHGAASELARERFRAERQILARLRHPHIASFLDGGVTDDGALYFVMELIRGEPLTRWADAHRLDVAGRLRLFLQVCDAVRAAHQALVVHRDLKPGNILVDESGQVKLLDFGIAKLLPQADDPGAEPATLVGARAFTPDYASPEQLQGHPIGTPSDVYSLGVVLFELLTGRRPFELGGRSSGEAERIVVDTAPPRPSGVLTGERALEIGERSAARARTRLWGDLDAITLMALRKEPALRYGSVAELADDVQRHLRGLPVRARPEGLGYRMGRLVRRHRVASAAIALAVASLATGTVVSIRQARTAELERTRATEVTAFLTRMLGAADPGALGREVQVREVLDSASIQAGELADRPALEAEIREIIGGTYLSLGEFARAEVEYRHALDRVRAVEPRGGTATARVLSRMATALEFQGNYAGADSVLTLATDLYRRHAPGREQTADHLGQRGRLLHRLGQWEGASALLQEAISILERVRPPNDSALAYEYANLGVVTSELGNRQAAESLLILAVNTARRAHGPSHPLVASILSPLASVQDWLDKPAAAESTYIAAMTIRETALGPEHPDFAWTMVNYADFLVERGRAVEAAAFGRRVLALRGTSLAESHPNIGTALSVLARAMVRVDSVASGIAYIREAVALRRQYLPPGHWATRVVEGRLGYYLALNRQFTEAESLLLGSEAALVTARGETSGEVRNARTWLAEMYEAWGRPADAAHWRTRLAAAQPAG